MKVLLVSANTERLNMVTIPLGLGLVCAAVRAARHAVTFLDLLSETDPPAAVRAAIAKVQPDVIGISVRNIDDQNRDAPRFLLEQVEPLVGACRAATLAPIVLGGAGYSLFPREALAYLGADYGVCGDGEVVFPQLLECLEHGEDPGDLPGVYVAGREDRRGLAMAADLDALPAWDESLTGTCDPSADDLWVPVQTRRGCPNDCSYCSTARIQGRTIRSRDPHLTVAAIERLGQAGYRRFYFVDNSFNIPESQALLICRLLRDLRPRVTWRCILYPHRVHEDLVRAMAEAGCSEASLGFESGSRRILREMNKRFSPEEVSEIVHLLAAYGIRRRGFLLLGGPGENRETVEESLAFAHSLPLDELRITVGIRIYPGTPLASRAVADGVIRSEDDLLEPCFYLAPGLEPWIHERVAASSSRPTC